jgi:hypothetical protein
MDTTPNPNYQKQLNKMEGQLNMIVAALNGNPFAEGEGNGGIVKDISELKTKLQDHINQTNARLQPVEKFKDRMYWTWVLVMTGSGVIGSCCGLVIAYLKIK